MNRRTAKSGAPVFCLHLLHNKTTYGHMYHRLFFALCYYICAMKYFNTFHRKTDQQRNRWKYFLVHP